MIEFVTYIEIPIRVFAEHQKYEPSTWNYPGCPEAMGVTDIEICNYNDETKMAVVLSELKDSILKECEDKFADEAWEYV